jgi:glutaredoxin
MDTAAKTATCYRMVKTDHMCPHGLKSKDLLERQGFQVEDRHLTSRDEVGAFKAKHDVKTTPQTYLGAERIVGCCGYLGGVRFPFHRTDSGMVHLDIDGAVGFAKGARR